MGEPVEQSAREAFGAEHLGPFGKRQRLEVLRSSQADPLYSPERNKALGHPRALCCSLLRRT
jgi:hypothetical protein